VQDFGRHLVDISDMCAAMRNGYRWTVSDLTGPSAYRSKRAALADFDPDPRSGHALMPLWQYIAFEITGSTSPRKNRKVYSQYPDKFSDLTVGDWIQCAYCLRKAMRIADAP
jgi:hypothetical protein